MVAYFLAVSTFVISAWLTWRLCNKELWFQILDHPNERSLHRYPTPRTGGIGILTAVFLTGLASTFHYGLSGGEFLWLVGLGMLISVISFADDHFGGLSVLYRLAVHIVAAALLVYSVVQAPALSLLPGSGWDLPRWLVDLVAVLFIAWMINLYNFMDGMDGLAGGMAVFGFGTFAMMGWLAGHESFMLFALIVAAAAGGFLLFNFPPAHIFMGDVGSTVLGFFAAALILWAQRDGIFPFWLGVLVFAPFIFDATVTLARRVMRGERFWEAHRAHYYQRFVRLNWGHRKTVLVEYCLMLGCSLTAILARNVTAFWQWVALLGWIMGYLLLFALVRRFEGRARARTLA